MWIRKRLEEALNLKKEKDNGTYKSNFMKKLLLPQVG